MTVQDLLDQITFDSGDQGSEYRMAARRWLNLARAYIADETIWRCALDPVATFTTSAATTSGVYALTGYEFVSGNDLYDETNETTIRHESLGNTQEVDPDKETTGPPTWWADAGMDSSGVRQVYLWPIPDGTYTIRFAGYRILTDLTANDENLSVDPFFGRISPWAAALTAGLRYYHDVNNNEDTNAVMRAQIALDKQIARKKAQNKVGPNVRFPARIIRAQLIANQGRFDPSHFDNRG